MEVELVLRNPRRKSDRFSLWLVPTKIPVTKRWLSALRETLSSEQELDKNYCFMGWPESPRDIPFLLKRLNHHLKILRNYKFPIPTFRGRNPTQSELNELHHRFELLIGQTWSRRRSFKAAPPHIRYSIIQINSCVHELEALRHSQAQLKLKGAATPKILITFMTGTRPLKELRAEDYEGFELFPRFGDVQMNYGQTGKPHFDAFIDQDRLVRGNNVNGLRYCTDEFLVSFAPDPIVHEVDDVMARFRKWLAARGWDLKPGKSYFIDKSGQRQAIGLPTVARLARQEFGKRTISQIHKLLRPYSDVYSIRLHDGRKTFERTYEHLSTERDYEQRQILSTMGFF